MALKNFNFSYHQLPVDELSTQQQALLAKAAEARENAYAPYSHFQVGAAVALNNGEIVTGNNQENAAYPSGLCAERVAVFAAKSRFPDAKIIRLAITTSAKNPHDAVSPCGSCRQVISEYENSQKSPIELIFQGENDSVIVIESANQLLPFVFGSDMLI